MNREEAKNYFKRTGKKIRQLKNQYRNNQRTMPVPNYYNSYVAHNDYFGPLVEYSSLSREFRHRHIAYSLLRGRQYEEIERTVRENNAPDWDRVEKYKKEMLTTESMEVKK